ncbi:fibronectin type III domain-containing protein [Nocardioides pakistanensis]
MTHRPTRLRRALATLIVILTAVAATLAGTGAGVSQALFTDHDLLAATGLTATVLDPPSDLGLAPDAEARDISIRLDWKPSPSEWVDGYQIYRAGSLAGPYTVVHTATGRANVSWTDTRPLAGTNHYTVRAYRRQWLDTTSPTAIPDPTVGTNSASAEAIRSPRVVVIRDARESQGMGTGFTGQQLAALGFTDVTYALDATTLADLEPYDIVVADQAVWAITAGDAALLQQAYDAGKRVFTAGNDSTNAVPLITSTGYINNDGGAWGYTSLNADTDPEFPSIDSGSTGSWDSMSAITGIAPDVIPVATWRYPSGLDAYMALTRIDRAGGRWFHMHHLTAGGVEGTVARAGMIWLTRDGGPVPIAPSAPTGVTAGLNGTSAVVSFTTPDDDGGKPISGYTVASTDGTLQVSGTSSPITVPGLRQGVSYRFTVTATNEIGTSVESAPSNAVALPSEPQSFGATSSGPSGTLQHYTIPVTGSYKIETWGAQGGADGSRLGGKGAYASGTFQFDAGTVLAILVGQQGTDRSTGGGGGGGTFVVGPGNTPLVIAGGGGGGFNSYTGDPGQAGTSGTRPSGGGGSGGTNGYGGGSVSSGQAGSGGGFYSAGGSGSSAPGGGAYPGNGGNGSYADGGYGGGGSGRDADAGGGGGYSGGGGGENNGGGGGSFVATTASGRSTSTGVWSGHGKVVITPLG